MTVLAEEAQGNVFPVRTGLDLERPIRVGLGERAKISNLALSDLLEVRHLVGDGSDRILRSERGVEPDLVLPRGAAGRAWS